MSISSCGSCSGIYYSSISYGGVLFELLWHTTEVFYIVVDIVAFHSGCSSGSGACCGMPE